MCVPSTNPPMMYQGPVELIGGTTYYVAIGSYDTMGAGTLTITEVRTARVGQLAFP